MTNAEFNALLFKDKVAYIKSTIDPAKLNYLIQKNRLIDTSEITYRSKMNIFLILTAPSDIIVDLTTLFEYRRVGYTLKGLNSVEVDLVEFINKLS